jgi:lysophospholipase L1-like esterase
MPRLNLGLGLPKRGGLSSALPLPGNVIAQYDMVTPGTGTTLDDISGNGNNATFYPGADPSWESYGLNFVTGALQVPASVWNAVNAGGSFLICKTATPYGASPPANFGGLLGTNVSQQFMYDIMDGRTFYSSIFSYSTVGFGANKSIQGPMSLGWVMSSPQAVYLNGEPSPGYVNPAPNPDVQTVTTFQIGAPVSSGAFWIGQQYYIIFWDLTLTPAQMAQAHRFAQKQIAPRGITLGNLWPNAPHVVWDGASNTIGQGPASPGIDPATLTMSQLTGTYPWENLGLSGQTAASIAAAAPQRANTLARQYSAKPSVYILFETAGNDLFVTGLTAAAAFANVQAAVAALPDFDQIAVCTILPRTGAGDSPDGFEVDRQTVNADILAYAWPANVTVLDIGGAGSHVGIPNSWATYTTLWETDDTHLTQLGMQYTITNYLLPYLSSIGVPATAPSVTAQPSSESIATGANTSFTSTASGGPTPTVQWQVNQGSGWANVVNGGVYSGATTTTLTITGATLGMSGYEYRAVFTNASGSAQSNAATLTVSSATYAAPTGVGVGGNLQQTTVTWTDPIFTGDSLASINLYQVVNSTPVLLQSGIGTGLGTFTFYNGATLNQGVPNTTPASQTFAVAGVAASSHVGPQGSAAGSLAVPSGIISWFSSMYGCCTDGSGAVPIPTNSTASVNVSTTFASSTSATAASAAGLAVGMFVLAPGFCNNQTYITAIVGTTITLSQAATASGTASATFSVDGSMIASWVPMGGTSTNLATQSTPINAPQWDAVEQSVCSSYLATQGFSSNIPFSNGQALSIFFILELNSLRDPNINGVASANGVGAFAEGTDLTFYYCGDPASLGPQGSVNWYNGSAVSTITLYPRGSKRILLGYVADPTSAEFLVNWDLTGSGKASNSASGTISALLADIGAPWPSQCKVLDILVYNSALSGAQIYADVIPYAWARGVPAYGSWSGAIGAYTDSVVCCGDSITQGGDSFLNRSWPSQLSLPASCMLCNTGESGITLSALAAQAAFEESLVVSGLSGKNILVIWAGTNDIAEGSTGATVYSTLASYISTMQGAGYKVIAVTPLPRGFTTVSGEYANYRNLILANTAGADAVADPIGNTTLAAGWPTQYLYSYDGIHPNAAGYALIVPILQSAVTGLL